MGHHVMFGHSETQCAGACASPPTARAIEQWLIAQLAEELRLPPAKIDVGTDMHRFGLDSATAVILAGDLGKHLGIKLSPALVWDYPTVRSLAEHVAGLIADPKTRAV